MREKLENHRVVKMLKEIFNLSYTDIRLVGGAVIDILDGKEPKDYDLIGCNEGILIKNGFIWVTDTANATTMEKDGIKVQLLKTKTEDFDFRISTSSVRFHKGNVYYDLKEYDITNKILIPQNYKDKKNILNSLSRIPHWRNKGYNISDSSYYSLLNGLSQGTTYPYNS